MAGDADRTTRRVRGAVAIVACVCLSLWALSSLQITCGRSKLPRIEALEAVPGLEPGTAGLPNDSRGLEFALPSETPPARFGSAPEVASAVGDHSSYFVQVVDEYARAVPTALVAPEQPYGRFLAVHPLDAGVVKIESVDTDGAAGASANFALLNRERARFRVRAPGFAEAIALFEPGHADVSAAQRVELSRAAGLTVVVTDEEGGALAGVTVRVAFRALDLVQGPLKPRLDNCRTMGYRRYPTEQRSVLVLDGLGEERVSRTTGADGECVFEGIAPFAPLYVEALRNGSLVGALGRQLTLQPGEQARVHLSIRSRIPVALRFVFEGGEPVRNQRIGIRQAEGRLRFDYFTSGQTFFRERTTDQDGRVEFKTLLEDSYYAGLLPEPRDRSRADAPAPSTIGVRIEVRSSDEFRVAQVVIPSAAYVTGVVSDAAGNPVENAFVFVASEQARGVVSVSTSGNGAFRVSPLVAGECVLGASDPHRELRSRSVRATASSDGVELRLEAPPRLSIRLISRDSSACRVGQVMVDTEDGMQLVPRFEPCDPGCLSFRPASVAPLAIIVTCEDGRMGVASMTAAGFDARRTIDIVVNASGEALVQNTEQERRVVDLRDSDGVRVARVVLEAGEARPVRLPVGDSTVEVIDGAVTRTSTIRVHAGPGNTIVVP